MEKNFLLTIWQTLLAYLLIFGKVIINVSWWNLLN